MGKHKQIFQRFLLVAGLVLFAICTYGVARAQNVTQGYGSESALQKGMIVRLKPGDSSKVEALSQQNAPDMFGVVVASGEATVSLTNIGNAQQVYVATYGQYDVLVSTQNGPIKQGDHVTISSLNGVGMKAESTQQLVIGKALKGFDGKTRSIGKTTLDTNKGPKEVSLGHVPIEVSVAHNPLYEKEKEAGVPDFLSKAAELVTSRPVSAFRIYVSMAVIILSFIIAGSILFAGVRSGMTAIGRNPLAKRSIVRNLIQVTLMSLIVFAIGLFAVYLVLRI
ncbi:MAG TPA: hypothetical protein VFT16_04695 [Candidatus Saccharimonadales bacterium]|nr:hypothetical protein [Candidatus Saccharimonadales bacterium]